MCRNGRYTEHGIKELDGFLRERYRIDPGFAVKLDPALERTGVLLEPTSVAAKAWDHLERIAARAVWSPEVALVVGAGSIGLLAALLAVQRGLEVHVLDRVTTGPKPALVANLGATYHTGTLAEAVARADVIVECTGSGELVLDAIAKAAADGIVCLTGVSSAGRTIPIDPGARTESWSWRTGWSWHRQRQPPPLPGGRGRPGQGRPPVAGALITRRVPLDRWPDALQRQPDDVKAVIDLPA